MSTSTITPRRNYLPDNRRQVVNMSEDTVNTILVRSQVRKPWEKEHESRDIRNITESVLPPKRDAEYSNVFMQTYKDVLETPVFTLPFNVPERLGAVGSGVLNSSGKSSDAVDAVQASAHAQSDSTHRVPSSLALTSKPFNDYSGLQRSGGGTFRSVASRSGRNTVSVSDGRATLALTRAAEHQRELSVLEKGLTQHLVTPRHALEQVPLRGSTVRVHSAMATTQLLQAVSPRKKGQPGQTGRVHSALSLLGSRSTHSQTLDRPRTGHSHTATTLPVVPAQNMTSFESPFQGGVYTATARPTSRLVSSRVLSATPSAFQAKEGDLDSALQIQLSNVQRVAKLVHLPTPPYAVLPLRLHAPAQNQRSVPPSLRVQSLPPTSAADDETLRQLRQSVYPVDSTTLYETNKTTLANCNNKYIESCDASVKLCLADYKTRAFACKRAGRAKGECIACFGIGLLLDNSHEYRDAQLWYCRARDLAKELNDMPLLQCLYNCISVSLAHIPGAEDTVQHYCRLGVELAEQLKDNFGSFAHYTNAGLLLTAVGRHSEATQQHLSAQQHAIESGDFLAQIAASGNVGFSASRQEQTTETRELAAVTQGEYVRQQDELLASPTSFLGKLDAKNVAIVHSVMLATRAEALCLLGTTLWELGDGGKARVFMHASLDTAIAANEQDIAGTARVALGMWKAQETLDHRLAMK